MKAFYVYMMTNRSRVVLYSGITNSLMRRVWQHQNGEIERFTKMYKVNRLVYYERVNDPRDAIAREKEIKGWRRDKKNALVETMNPKWADLSPMLFQHTRVIPNEIRDPTKRARATQTSFGSSQTPYERSLAPLGMTLI
jgi:putative endonuclease